MNTKQVCYLSALIAIYGVSRIYVPVSTPFFPFGLYVLALFFPLIDKKMRVLFTVIVQGIDIYKLGLMINSFRGLGVGLSNYIMNLPIKSEPQGFMTDFWLFVKITDPAFYYSVITSFILVAIATLLFEVVYLFTLLTAPYSIYLIFEKVGVYRFISKQTGGRFTLGGKVHE